MSLREAPHEHAHAAATTDRRALLEASRRLGEPVREVVLDAKLQEILRSLWTVVRRRK